MTPIGIQLRLDGDRQVEAGLRRVSGAMDTVGSAAGMVSRAVGGMAGAFAGAISAREFIQAADAVTGLQNQLKLATGSAQAAGTAYSALFDIAQRSRVSFTELGSTFAQMSRATSDLGISQQRLLTVSEAIGNAMTISGGSAESMRAALVQLGQGLASGTLRGEELNSVMEQTPRLAKALADGLGVTRGELRALGQQGAITAEQVIKALESQSTALAGEVKDATLTVGQAFTQLKNSATMAVGEFDKATGASGALATTVGQLAAAIGGLGNVIRENEGAFKVLGGTLAGAAVIAGAAGLVKSLGMIGAAVGTLGAVLMANPVVLALLGLGAAVGGGIALIDAQSKTASGINQAIDRLQGENERSAAAMERALAGGRAAGAANIARVIDERKSQIAQLRAELDALNPSNAGAGGGRGSVNPATVGAAAAAQAAGEKELIALRQKLSGVDKDYLPTLTKLHAQYEAGRLSLTEYRDLVGKLADANFKKDKSGGGASKALNEEQAAYESLVSSIQGKIDADKLELSTGSKATDAQRIRLELDRDLAAGRLTLTAAHEAIVRALIQEREESGAAVLAKKTLEKADIDAAQAREKYLQSLGDGLDKIQADILAQEEATARMGLSKQAIAELDAAKLEMLATDRELQAIKAMDRNLDQQAYDALKAQAQAYRDLAAARKTGAAKEAALDHEREAKDAAKKAADEWQKTADDINRSLTDALMRGFESGESFADNFRKTIVNMFKTMVLRPVISAVLSPISGGIASLMGGGAGGAAGSSPLGMASNAYSLYNAGSQAWTLGSQWLNGSMSGANVLGTAWANATGGGLDALLATNGAYGTAGAGGIMGTIGKLAGPLAAVAGLAAAFGAFAKTEKVGGGLQGTLGSGVISDYTLMRTGGSLFSGPDYDVLNKYRQLPELERQRDAAAGTQAGWLLQTQIDDLLKNHAGSLEETVKTSNALQKTYADMRENTAKLAESLGLSGDAIRDFTTAIGKDRLGDTGELGLAFDGLKPEEIQAKIADALATANNEMAEQLLGSWKTVTDTISTSIREGMWDTGITYDTVTSTRDRQVYVPSEFARDGEKAIDTLTRLAGSFGAVSTTADALGYGMGQASLAAANAASNIVDAFGGLEAFTQTLGAYFENFYSDAEQKAATARQVSRALGNVGIELDAAAIENMTRPAIRAFVESIGAQFGAESEQYVAAVQQANVLASVTAALPPVLAATQAIDTAAQDAARAAEEARKKWQDITDALLSDRFSADMALLRAMGKEEEALAKERLRAIEGYDAYQVGLYDGTQAILAQVSALEKQAEATEVARQKALELSQTIASELPGAIDKYLTPAQRQSAGYEGISADLGRAGINVSAQDLAAASKDQIAAAAVSLYNLGSTSDETRLALIRAASGLADLKDQALGLAQSQTDAAYAALEREVNARRGVLQEALADVRSVFDAVGDAARSLYGDVQSTAAMLGAQGRDFIANAARNASATGYLPDPEDLQKAISAVTNDLGRQIYATQFDADRDRLVLAAQLSDLEGIAGDQLTETERQIKALDGILDTARQQIDALRGIDASVLGVDARIAMLAEAIAGEKAAKARAGGGGGPGGNRTSSGQLLPGWSNWGAGGDWVVNAGGSLVADAKTGNLYGQDGSSITRGQLTREAAALIEAGQSMAVYDAIKASGFTLAQADKVLGLGAGTAEEWAKAMGLPVFHSGTAYVPQTGLALLEQGEAVIPRAFNPFTNAAGASGNAEVVAELRQLREDNRAQAGQIIRLQGQMAKLLSKWDDEGQPEEREAVTA